jgi:SpoVK/Ycf46/Vps4 family AAA+-type ATPase
MSKRKIFDVTNESSIAGIKKKKRSRIDNVYKSVMTLNDDLDYTVYIKSAVPDDNGEIDQWPENNFNCIKIGDFIYKLQWVDWVLDGYIAINRYSLKDIAQYLDDGEVMGTLANSSSLLYKAIPKVYMTVSNQSLRQFGFSANELWTWVYNKLYNWYVSKNQTFVFHISGTEFRFRITDIKFPTKTDTAPSKFERCGYITNTTEPILIADSDTTLYYDEISIPGTALTAVINACTELPKALKQTEVYEALQDRLLKGNNWKLFHDDKITFKVGLLKLKATLSVDIAERKKHNKMVMYQLNDLQVNIKNNLAGLTLVSESNIATKVRFNITCLAKQMVLASCIDIENEIRKVIQSVSKGHIYTFTIGTQVFTAKAEMIQGPTRDTVFMISKDTKFVFRATKDDNCLITNGEQKEIETVHITIKREKVAGLLALLMGGGDDSKNMGFDPKKLRKIIKRTLPKIIAVGYRHVAHYHALNKSFVAKVNDIKFVTNSPGGPSEMQVETKGDTKGDTKYPACGEITDDTNIEFNIPEKQGISLLVQAQVVENPLEELEKHVGGLTNEILEMIRNVVLARGKLSGIFKKRGMKYEKGIIFHGPPGTGKTSIARQIGRIFDCKGDRFNLISGPELLSKWVGESEKNIRKLFAPAKEAWKKFGEKSPMYILVIDEIDSILPNRSGSISVHSDKVVSQFLAEIDGLTQFDNFLCIGTTNRLELMDQAALRPGRFGTSIKIDLPNAKGRKDIFNIHTKTIREVACLSDDVNFERLISSTDKFSGADIEGLIVKASNYSLERLSKLKEIDDDAMKKYGLITMKDFETALEKHKSKLGNDAPPCMYM